MKFKRVFLFVLDSLGVGELPDASDYGDAGANTLKSCLAAKPNLELPNLRSLGLLKLAGLDESSPKLPSAYAKMKEASVGKDTTTGHWEMMGVIIKKPFSYFLEGFPEELMNEFVQRNALPGYLGNRAASGTQIVEDLGEEHQKTGKPIVYTSADSVFQIAAHEESFGLEQLYKVCEETRELLNESPYLVGRVIARPFIGGPGSYKRTENRQDYSIDPFSETVLERLQRKGIRTIGVGKIPSIYNGKGITEPVRAKSDQAGLEESLRLVRQAPESSFVFVNFNDLDMLYGHRRNALGYAEQLERLDSGLGAVLQELKDSDLLILAADHGNDPSFKGSDHTREFVPLIAYSKSFERARELPVRNSFCDIGESLLENFGVPQLGCGQSFLQDLVSGDYV